MGFSPSLHADMLTEFNQDKDFAKQMNVGFINNVQSFDPNTLPSYNPNPQQVNYYKNPANIEKDAGQASQSDSTAKAVITQFESGPKFKIDPKSPEIQRIYTAQDDSFNITHGIPDKYNNNCKPEQTCTPSNTEKHCEVSHSFSPQCTNTLTPTVTYKPYQFDCNHLSQNGFQFSLIPGPSPDGMCVTGFTYFYVGGINQNYDVHNTVNIVLPPNVTAHANMAVRGLDSNWNFNPANGDKLSFEINGDAVIPDVSIINPPFAPDSHGNVLYAAAGKDFSTPAQDNVVNLSFKYHLYSHGPITGIQPAVFYITYPNKAFNNPEVTETWVSSCPNISNLSICTKQSEVCTDKQNSKVINGTPVTEPCWQYKQVYQCGSDTNSCSADSLANCSQINAKCSNKIGDFCLSYQNTYSCQTQQCVNHGMACGGNIFCLDGDCVKPTPTQNKNFGKNDAEVAAVVEGVSGLAGSQDAHVFTGAASSCNKDFLGYLNCCADKGWGKDLNLGKCSEQEKDLGEAKEKGLTVFVGEYCSKKVLGACVQHKQSYCVFHNLIGLDVQTKGRLGQLGISFGADKTPDCRGLNVEELQKIDFSKIDFTNVVEEIESKATFPDQDKVNAAIKEKIQQEIGH